MIEGTVRHTVYSSAARTATPTAPTFSAEGRTAMHCVIDVTAITSSPSVVPTIDGYDPLSGKWYNLLTGVAVTDTGTTVLKIGRGIAASANAAAADFVPDTFRVVMTHGDGDSITYSVSVHLVP